ncbi:glyceraldehyde-3-phosphate dehydrogenase 1 [Allomyces javanicus]|nr:glyceraldehyde-3-phosphate dehydrogenase 1 [Allomyces javanicus]
MKIAHLSTLFSPATFASLGRRGSASPSIAPSTATTAAVVGAATATPPASPTVGPTKPTLRTSNPPDLLLDRPIISGPVSPAPSACGSDHDDDLRGDHAGAASWLLDDPVRRAHYSALIKYLYAHPHVVAQWIVQPSPNQDRLVAWVTNGLYRRFRHHGADEAGVLAILDHLLADHFASVSDAGSLLRATSPATKLLAAYTQTDTARHYLDSIVADRVAVLAQIPDLDVEVDPTRTDAPPAVCAARMRLLQDLTAALFTAILASLDRVPLGIRRICAQIRRLALHKDPCAPRAHVAAVIGGFFLLRFVNPALVTAPALPPPTRRAVTLVAKVLQHLANQPSRTKEPYMAPLHAWSEAHADTMQRFLLAVADDSVNDDDASDLYARGAPAAPAMVRMAGYDLVAVRVMLAATPTTDLDPALVPLRDSLCGASATTLTRPLPPTVLAAQYPIPLDPMAAPPFLPAELAATDPNEAAAAVATAAVVAELEQALVRVPPSMRGVLRHVPPASAAWLDAILHSAGTPVQRQVRELFAAGITTPARLAYRVAVAVAYARQREAERNAFEAVLAAGVHAVRVAEEQTSLARAV